MKRVLALAVTVGGSWGLAQVALAAPVLAQISDPAQSLGPVGGVAVPGSIGALILFLAYSLKEVYRQLCDAKSEAAQSLADERVSSANRVAEEAKAFASQLQLIYESNKADLARIYSETRDLVQQSTARQDAMAERLMTLIVSQMAQMPKVKGESKL